jgi:Uma2 family endonuclease
MRVADKTALTVAELLQRPDHERFELIGGEVAEREEMNPEAVWTMGRVLRRLEDACAARPEFLAFGDGVAYTLGDHSEREYRKPDVSVIRRAQLPSGKLPETYFTFAPELAVEVASPSDSLWDLERRAQEYLAAGTKVVWLVRPVMRGVTAYFPDGSERNFGPRDALDGTPVLPELSFPVADIFPPAELRA